MNYIVEKILFVLKKDGIFILRVPYKEDLSGYLEKAYPYDLVHLRSFDEFGLIMLFTKIFKCTVLEYNFTGFQGGQLRYFRHIKLLNWVFTKSLRLVRKFSIPAYKYLSRILCIPIEINFVIKKS